MAEIAWSELLHRFNALPLVIDIGIKSIVLLLVTAIVVRLIRRASASARYSVWLGAMISLLALPMLCRWVPGIHVLPRPTALAAPTTPATSSQGPGINTDVPWDPWGPDIHYFPPPPQAREIQHQMSQVQPNTTSFTAPPPPSPAPLSSPIARTISLRPLATMAWAIGALLTLLPAIRGIGGLWLLRASAFPIHDRSWGRLVERLARQMGIARRIELLEGEAGMMPMTWGILRPCILLPREAHDWTPQRRRVVLLHELAHVRRWDCLAQLLTHVVCALYWFNPLAWLAARKMRSLREQACDDLVLELGNEPMPYAEHLLEVAASASRFCGRATAAIAMARISTLEGRLRAILDPSRSRQAMTRPAVVMVAAIIALTVIVAAIVKFKDDPEKGAHPAQGVSAPQLPATQPTPAPAAALVKESKTVADAPNPDLPPPDRSMEVTLIDEETKEPLPDVKVRLRIGNASRADHTDAKGRLWIMLGQTPPKYLSVTPEAPNYAPLRVQWQGSIALPSNYTFVMQKGATIGGMVVDEAQKPIAGAKVVIQAVETSKPDGETWLDIQEEPCVTDANGRWECPNITPSLKQLWVRLEHPDYISDEMFGASAQPAMPELRSRSAVMVMKKGIEVAGKVTDMEGRPLAGAKVLQGADRWGSHYPETRTDNQGVYRFPNARPGPMVLTVQTVGYAPDLRDITVAKRMASVDFKLGVGNDLHGKVVDEDGLPVRKAWIAADTWRGHRSIDFRADTDADGRFTWLDAPKDEVLFDMGKQGFQSVRHKAIKAGDDEVVVTLPKPMKVSGSVVDAETGEPIKRFKVLTGAKWGADQPPYFDQNRPLAGADGKYEVFFDETQYARIVRIEAEGYIPATSPDYTENRPQTFDVKLKKGHGPTGIVLTPDGKPAKGAQVGLYTKGKYAQIIDGHLQENSGVEIALTKEDGRFTFPPQEVDSYSLIILHESGMLEPTPQQLEKEGTFTLQGYGTIKGIARRGTKPMTGQRLSLVLPERNAGGRNIYFSYSVSTDAQGGFTFERVPPGPATINKAERVAIDATTWSEQFTPLAETVVKQGETVRVVAGGTGRRVTGRIKLPAQAQAGGWGATSVLLRPPHAEPELPDTWLDMTAPERQKLWNDWQESPQGKASTKLVQAGSGIIVQPDGRFEKEEVPPGTYQLNAYVMSPPEPGTRIVRQLGILRADVTVADGDVDQPVDLGEFAIKALPDSNVGAPASELTGDGLDGKSFKLSEHRGQWVLIDLFTPQWRRPEDATKASDLARKLTSAGKVIVVRAAVGSTRHLFEAYAKKYPSAGIVVWTGDWEHENSVVNYSMEGTVDWLLISPDGKIAARDFPTEKVEEEIAKAMK
jgi:beta-lactamase regulating signal transducer with metallopeptidase domain